MTEFPEAPPPRKSTPWKIIIPVAVVVILCCLCIVVFGVLMYLGTQGSGPFKSLANSPVLTSSPSVVGDWDFYYDWGCTGSYSGPVSLTLYGDGGFYAVEDTGSGYGTWWIQGKTLEFMYDEYPNAHYIGTTDNAGDYVDGTMSTSDDSEGCFYAEKR